MSDEAEAEFRHFVEHVRLLLEKDLLEGLKRWSEYFTELLQEGEYGLCGQLLLVVKAVRLPPHGVGIVRYAEGQLHDRGGQPRKAIAAYESGLAAFTAAGLPLDALMLVQIGSLHQDQGDWAPAEAAYERALAVAEEKQDRHGRGMVLNNLGGLHSLRNDTERAHACFGEARALFHETGDRYNYGAANVGLANALRDDGKYQDAVTALVESLTVFDELGNVRGVASTVASLALTYH